MSTFVAELKKQHTAFMKKQARQATVRRNDRSMLREEEFHYTDASKYAKQYYGDIYHETTRHDKDWGDY